MGARIDVLIRRCLITALGAGVIMFASQSVEAACRWVGTAPSCDGQLTDCNANEDALELQGASSKMLAIRIGREDRRPRRKQATKKALPTSWRLPQDGGRADCRSPEAEKLAVRQRAAAAAPRAVSQGGQLMHKA
jgi:hypothetical protein